jgi:hypothetical protein
MSVVGATITTQTKGNKWKSEQHTQPLQVVLLGLLKQ